NQPDSIVQVASNTKLGQNLAFKISGEGTLEARQEGENGQGGGAQESSGGGQAAPGPANNRPGGGLGPPIDAPDPLQKYQWWILGGLAAFLIIGAVYVASRQQSAARALARQKSGSSTGSLMTGMSTSETMLEEDEY